MAVPLCQYFSKCSGCQLQHIDYLIQAKNKVQSVSSALKFDSVQFEQSSPYNYRSRMDFYFSGQGICLRSKKGLIPVKSCPISNSKVNKLLSELWSMFYYTDDFPVSKFKSVTARASEFTDSSSVVFILSDELNLNVPLSLIREFAENTSAENVAYDAGGLVVLKGSKFGVESINRDFKFPIGGFFQNNPDVAKKMVMHVEGIFSSYKTKESVLLDLYGGVGLFGFSLSSHFSAALVVESAPDSFEAAKKNISS